jgi:maltooligosyltrehalose trehalohydrolase
VVTAEKRPENYMAESADRPASSSLGAVLAKNSECEFTVWAPRAKNVEVRLIDDARLMRLSPEAHGYYIGRASGVRSDARYTYRVNDQKDWPDPASRFQPEGVFGPSQIVDLKKAAWADQGWRGLELKEYIVYELHVGTYTSAGTLDAIIGHLQDLKSLGVTAVELMPLAQFSGTRNWGYDGVFPFAVQNTYGGPLALQRLVNACHQIGLAVVLDVVYNHLGPEGNVLLNFGPYFTDRYRTPWGDAVNFDGPQSDDVVRYFLENAIGWLDDFHIDALRLDAIHGIFDRSAQPFLALLSAATDEFAARTNRRVYLIAETDLNDSRFITPRYSGGYGLHAQWNDDFHHSLHSLQTGERAGYYRDFGSLRDLKKAFEQSYVYTGQYSEYRKHRHGNSPDATRRSQMVVCSQNHDQVGNRMLGDRTSTLLTFEAQKLSAACVVLSPYVPLLFMGEEYGDTAPFLYFTSHKDPALARAVRDGRAREFAAFHAQGSPPDPQAEETFLRSKLDHSLRDKNRHQAMWNFYRELIRLRKTLPALSDPDASTLTVEIEEAARCLEVMRRYEASEVLMVFNFGLQAKTCWSTTSQDDWQVLLDSADTKWMGPGTSIDGTEGDRKLIKPQSVRVYQRR